VTSSPPAGLQTDDVTVSSGQQIGDVGRVMVMSPPEEASTPIARLLRLFIVHQPLPL